MLGYIHTLRKKIATLQGDGFDPKMSVADYHRLINIQKVFARCWTCHFLEKVLLILYLSFVCSLY
jgi:hypothetical protein